MLKYISNTLDIFIWVYKFLNLCKTMYICECEHYGLKRFLSQTGLTAFHLESISDLAIVDAKNAAMAFLGQVLTNSKPANIYL